MKRQSSTTASQSQRDSRIPSEIAARLREERHRIEPHQGRFARRIGITQGKLSHLEIGRTEAKAEDLAAVAAAGVDVHYVLTGNRLDNGMLDPAASAVLSDYLALPSDLKPVASGVLRTMRELGEHGSAAADPTLKGGRSELRAGEGR